MDYNSAGGETGVGAGMESERQARKWRIDPALRAQGWEIAPYAPERPLGGYARQAIEEYPTANGPADYGLCLDGRIVGIVEAKRLGLSAEGVLTQAERYARGL